MMKRTVARESEDGLQLKEWDFIVGKLSEDEITLRLVGFRISQRSSSKDYVPFEGPIYHWTIYNYEKTNNIQKPEAIPDSVMDELRKWIFSNITFEL